MVAERGASNRVGGAPLRRVEEQVAAARSDDVGLEFGKVAPLKQRGNEQERQQLQQQDVLCAQ
ncbi:hypothetical protein [Accumulibacter sp.]|uniref:hypothetical protein n=1 Tax=Accumulibacter sp. TaxID=2053492 RepID=UPI00257A33E2|nr:hypothetical protein [Accumulibacter sp.]